MTTIVWTIRPDLVAETRSALIAARSLDVAAFAACAERRESLLADEFAAAYAAYPSRTLEEDELLCGTIMEQARDVELLEARDAIVARMEAAIGT